MQGQRGTIGSLPEIEFDLGSSSNNTTMDQQICWSNLRNPPENHIPEYLLSQNDMDVAFVNSMSRERQTLARWRSNEASSSNPQSEVSREKLELGWPSSGLRLEPSNNAAVPDNSPVLMFSQSSNTNPVQPSLNLGFTGQVSQFPSSFKFGGTESEQFLVGSESDGRQSSVDRGQVSCKRKAIEGSIGPSSSSNGSISYFQRSNTDLNSRPLLSTTAQNEAESGQSTFTPSSEQGAPTGLGLGFPEPNAMEIPESSQRNVRRRTSLTSSSTQQMVNASSLTSGRGSRRSGLLSAQHPAMNFEPVDLSLEPRTISAVDNTRNPSQVHVIDAPPLQQQTVHPLRWAGASLPRTGSSLSSLTFGERDSPVLPREELSSRAMARAALPERIHHTFVPVPDFRNMARHPRSVTGSSANASANGASSTSPAALAPSWQLHPLLPLQQQQQQQQQQQHNHHQQQQQPRRMSDFLRRSLFPIVGTESSGGQGSNYAAAMRAGQAGSSNEMGGGAGNHHHHLQSNPRLATWLERHDGNNGLGMHYSLRALGVGPDNTTRLVSEQIRNVLGIIRRGESLRFEDVMILEPAMFAGMAEMHDRHRDMRLDVDHMSYEELLALEERIGNVSTGLSEETVLKCLKQKKYAIAENLQSETEPCCVCQEDYNEGEDIGILECGHDFHKDCIKQWLTQKNLCPICKTTALKM